MPASLLPLLVLCYFAARCQAQTQIVFHLVEECPNNTLIGNVRQRLAASGRFLEQDLITFSYKLLSTNRLVRLDSSTGAMYTHRRVDREALCGDMNLCCSEDEEEESGVCRLKCQVALMAADKQNFREMLLVELVVDDINDNAPSWRSHSIELDIPEHTPVNTRFKLPTAHDPDRGPDNTTARYGIASQSSTGMFSLDADPVSSAPHRRRQFDLWLKVNRDMDREEADFHRVTMIAIDEGRPARTGTVIINVTVTDINDQRPTFRALNPQTAIREDKLVHTQVYNMSAHDRDKSDQKRLVYKLGSSANEAVLRAFSIDKKRGLVYVSGELDYEKHRKYVIPVTVTDGKHVSETSLTVNVINVNDNPPTILLHSMAPDGQIEIKENQPRDTTIATVEVSDKDDKRKKDAIDCYITGSDDFSLRPLLLGTVNMHRIVTRVEFDREQQTSSRATIECTDRKEPRQTTRKPFKVKIRDVNDSPPVFQNTPMVARIREDKPDNTEVIRVLAKDADSEENAQIWYALDSQSQQRFSIDRKSGLIKTRVRFDRETVSTVNVTVIARDRYESAYGPPTDPPYPYDSVSRRRGGGGRLGARPVVNTVSATVQVIIEDANDCAPVFDSSTYKFDVVENSKVNTQVGRLVATDRDVTSPNNRITYSMLQKKDDNSMQYFKVMSNGVILTKRGDVDRENTPLLTFTALAKDGGKPARTSSVSVYVKVHDENDHSPTWQFPTRQQRSVNITYDTPVGHKVAQLIATDMDDGAFGEVVYSLVRGNERGVFELDKTSGALYLTRTLNKPDIRMYQLMVKASDKAASPRSVFSALDVYVLTQQPRPPPRRSRGDNSQLIILISIVTVTLIISLFLIAAIVFLRCGRCRKLAWPPRRRPPPPGIPNGRATYFPDGNSSPGVAEMPTKARMQTMERLRPLYTENKCHGEDGESLDSSRGCSSETGRATRSDSVLMQKIQPGPLTDSPNMNPYSIDGKRPPCKVTSFRTPQLDGTRTSMRGRFSVTWDPNADPTTLGGTLPQSSYQHLGRGGIDESNYSNVPEEETRLTLRRDDYNDIRAYTPLTHARLSSPNLYTRQPTSFV